MKPTFFPGSRFCAIAFLVAAVSSMSLISCKPGESKSQSQDSTSAMADLPFDTLVTFCNWTELGLRATPSEKGKFVTTVYLGEHLVLSGDTATEVNQGKTVLFRKAKLADGREGWLRDEFLARESVPGVVVRSASVYVRPEETTMSDKTFAVFDIVAVKPSKGNWVEVNGKPADKTWFQKGYIHMEELSLIKRDVDLAVLYRRATEAKDAATQQSRLDHIRDNTYFQGSSLYQVLFPTGPADDSDYQEEEEEEEDPALATTYTMYNFSGSTGDLENNGAIFIPDGDGVSNAALSFNGNSYLTKAMEGTFDASYCFWIMSKKVQEEAIAILLGNGCTSGYAINLVDDKNGGMKVTVLCGGITADVTHSNYSLPIDQWVHLCLVKTRNNFSIYVDGELSTSGDSGYNVPEGGLVVGGSRGCNPTDVHGSFYGNIDDLYVAPFALDEAGVREVKSGKFK